MNGDSNGSWLHQNQGLLVTVSLVVLTLVATLGWVESCAQREARERDLGELTAALREQAAAIDGQSRVMAERLRLEYLPAPRILTPEPFANRGPAAVVSVAATNEIGPARDARLTAVLLCCARLESLAYKPESVLLVDSSSPEVRPLLGVGETIRHEIVLDAPDHPVRRTVRERLEQGVWLWVALRYQEPLTVATEDSGEQAQALSFVWDSVTWSWATATAEQHAAVEEILAARGFLEPSAGE